MKKNFKIGLVFSALLLAVVFAGCVDQVQEYCKAQNDAYGEEPAYFCMPVGAPKLNNAAIYNGEAAPEFASAIAPQCKWHSERSGPFGMFVNEYWELVRPIPIEACDPALGFVGCKVEADGSNAYCYKPGSSPEHPIPGIETPGPGGPLVPEM
ncbi:MAG: hypothetical protein PHH08_01035 [Candidatus ainarchaeum sp.]|nr:hypothetical protein [Candidatus ainarchaeum sp.]